MKTAPHLVPIPPRLAARPRWHGLPVPYIALIKPDGVADFRVTDHEARMEVIRGHRCQLCGQLLGRYCFFVGGPKCAEALAYFEPAAHLDCLLYAMRVCPFIAGKMEHAPVADVAQDNPHVSIQADAHYSTEKSPWWVIVKATGYHLVRATDDTLLVRPEGVQGRTPLLHAQSMGASEWEIVRRNLFDCSPTTPTQP